MNTNSSTSAQKITGKVALVTGGSRGLGAAIAKRLAADGAAVAITYTRAPQKADEVVSAITATGGRAIAIKADSGDADAVQAAVAETVKTLGRLDILVNNAGIFVGKGVEEASMDEWHRLVAVNLTGVVLGTKIALPHLKARGAASAHGSAIVNLASVAGLVGSQLDPLYSLTKGCLLYTSASRSSPTPNRPITTGTKPMPS